MLKIASIVLNNFKNDSRVLKTNISLQNAGYSVQVVALWEDGVEEFEVIQNIPVHRVKLKSKDWSKNKLVQLVKYLELMYKCVKLYKDYDVIHCNDLNALPIGVVMKKYFNKNIKIVYDAHEHESYRAGYGNTIQALSRWFEGKLIKYADKVITVSKAIADDYERMYNIEKPVLVLNAPFYRKVEKTDIFRTRFSIPKDDIIFLYQGGLSPNRGILEFAEQISNIKGYSYIVMGYGALESEIKKFSKNTTNIFFHEAVAPDVLLSYTCSADIGICIEKPICRSWDYALPNKLFEYIMSDLCVIVGGLSEMTKFVKKNDVGFIMDNIEDSKSFKLLLEKVSLEYIQKKENLEKIRKIYNWEMQEKILIKSYLEIEDIKC